MRRYSVFPHLFLCLLTLLFSPPDSKSADNDSPFEHIRITIAGNGTAGPYEAGRMFIGGSAQVDSAGTEGLSIASENPSEGTITFTGPVAPGDSVTVTIAIPPAWLKESYQRQDISMPDSFIPGPSRAEPATVAPRATPGLTFGGAKTFDINLGSNAETALNQTLRLNVSGRLAEGITLNADISDQNVPILPEGNTRQLDELDRILIEIRGRNFQAFMGDTDLKYQDGRWLSFERRLSGVSLGVNAGPVEVFGSGALSEGHRQTAVISPFEGNQGPYRLIAQDGRKDITIVPGTETIWINGEQLIRGTGDDYTIDYTTGEVSFTERRIIGADMRIVCDYEYASESYLRNVYSGGMRGSFSGGHLKFTVLAAREADNPGKPVLYQMDAQTRLLLHDSGDNPAIVSGISPAKSDSTGTYDLDGGRLVYDPSGKGAYQARFSWVGEGKGSYRYLGGGIYEFVLPENRLPGAGVSYDPVSLVEGPVSHDLAGVNISADPFPAMHVEAELAGSSTDLNTLSPLGDNNNVGGAQRFGVKFSPEMKVGIPLKAGLSVDYRSQDSRFNPLDRDREAEANRAWGIPLVTGAQAETVSEYQAGLTVNGGMLTGTGLSLDGGSASFGESESSRRFGVLGQVLAGERMEARIRLNRIAREQDTGAPDGRITQANASMAATIAGFRTTAAYEGEQTEGAGETSFGSLYHDFRAAVTIPRVFGLAGDVDWFYRTEKAKQTAWTDSAFVRGGGIGFSTAADRNSMLQAHYSRRERISAAGEVGADQGSVDFSFQPDDLFYRFEGAYRAGRSREASKRKNYLFLGQGRGQYRWEDMNGDGIRDPDEFIPDALGPYYLYEETLEDYKPVNMVSVNGRFILDTSSGADRGGYAWMIPFRSETSFEIDEKSSASARDVFLLKLNEFRKVGATVEGNSRLQQDLTIPFEKGNGSVRLRYFRSDLFSAEYITGAERNRQEEHSVRVRLPITEQYDIEATIIQSFWNRAMAGGAMSNYRIESRSGDAGFSWYPLGAVTLGATLGGGIDRDRVSALKAVFVQAAPTAAYRFSGKGRAECTYTLTRVSLGDRDSNVLIPPPMARGQKAGANHEVTVALDYRLSNRMSLLASYTGRKFGGQKFEQFARTQVRALF